LARGQLTPKQLETALRDYALGFPEATEDFPRGERAIKVKGKVFLFMGADGDEVSFSIKLPHSRFFVLDLPNTEADALWAGEAWVGDRAFSGGAKLVARHLQDVDRRELSRGGAEEARCAAGGCEHTCQEAP
jgi:hypothetical protein